MFEIFVWFMSCVGAGIVIGLIVGWGSVDPEVEKENAEIKKFLQENNINISFQIENESFQPFQIENERIRDLAKQAGWDDQR